MLWGIRGTWNGVMLAVALAGMGSFLAGTLQSCSKSHPSRAQADQIPAQVEGQLPGVARLLAEQLATRTEVPRESLPLVMSNFVDGTHLECTSLFGRYLAENLSGELQRQGFPMVDAKRGLTLRMEKDTGEYILTQNVNRLTPEVRCNGVVAGTYLVTGDNITVNARIIHLEDNHVMASAARSLPLSPDVFALLNPEGYGCPPAPDAGLAVRAFGSTPGSRDDASQEASPPGSFE